MCLVVCLHTTFNYINSERINVEYVLYNTSVIAIPLFFMVSGFLLIGKEKNFRYVYKKIYGILRFVLIIITIWWIGYSVLRGFNIQLLLNTFLGSFVQIGQFSKFWYFGALIILYFIYPAINELSKFKKYYLFTICIIGTLQNIAFLWNITDAGEMHVPQPLRLWNWIFYFMLGGLLKDVTINSKLIVCSIVLLLLANILVIHWLSPIIGSKYCEFFYGCPIVIFLSSSIFVFIGQIRLKNNKLITYGSQLFLPVYTFHPFFINLLNHLNVYKFGGIIFYISVLVSTILFSWILMQIPFIKQVFKI